MKKASVIIGLLFIVCADGETKLAIDYAGMIPLLTAAFNAQQDIVAQQQQAIGQRQVEIEILQQVATGQEYDLMELNELRNKVEELQSVVDIQQHTIDELKNIVLLCCNNASFTARQQDTSLNNNNVLNRAVLYQNMPNSFSSNTDIAYYIPTIQNNAFVYIYNLQGTQVKSFQATQGSNTATIYASELPAGMYLYTLVVDDVLVDSKRIILTQ